MNNVQRYVLLGGVIQIFMVIWAATRGMALSYLPIGLTLAVLYVLIDLCMIRIKGNRRLLAYLYLLCTLGCIFQTFMSSYLTTSSGTFVISIVGLVKNYVVAVCATFLVVPILTKIVSNTPNLFWAVVFGGLACTGFVLLYAFPDAVFQKTGVRISISIFGRSVQIMEFIKLGIILALGFVFSSRLPSNKKGIWAMILFGINGIGLITCSEFGTLLIILCTMLFLMLMLCDDYKPAIRFLAVGGACVLLFWLLKTIGISFFVEQWSKIEVRIVDAWWNSSDNINGAGYQIETAKKAASLGGWLGCTKEEMMYYRVAVEDSDMIFPKMVSAGGIVLAGMVLLLLFLVFRECFYIVLMIQKDTKGILTMALYMMMLFQVLIILCGSMGLMPLTGVPLIFISHGGMSLMTSIFSMGYILYCSKKEWRE